MKKIRVIAIIGPTAIGKSDYAVKLARKIGGEIISADSRQVYRGLNIGTGKIFKSEMQNVPHHMLDIASPKKRISVVRYTEQARKIISEIHSRGKIPIVCGGTGFYVEELLFPSSLPNVKANPKLRLKLATKTTTELFKMLNKKDPRRAREIDPKNKVRLIRALEIAEKLGHVPERPARRHPYDVSIILLDAPLDTIRKKVHARLLKRIKQGLIAEGKRLRKNGLSYKGMQNFGLEYKWLALLLQNKISKDEFVAGLEKDIVAYARRQKTFFRGMQKNYSPLFIKKIKV